MLVDAALGKILACSGWGRGSHVPWVTFPGCLPLAPLSVQSPDSKMSLCCLLEGSENRVPASLFLPISHSLGLGSSGRAWVIPQILFPVFSEGLSGLGTRFTEPRVASLPPCVTGCHVAQAHLKHTVWLRMSPVSTSGVLGSQVPPPCLVSVVLGMEPRASTHGASEMEPFNIKEGNFVDVELHCHSCPPPQVPPNAPWQN